MPEATPPTPPAAAQAEPATAGSPPPPTPSEGSAGFLTPPPTAKPGTPSFATDPTKPVSPDAPKAPEKYELKNPDGSRLDQAGIERIEAYARAQGLSNEQAQQYLEYIHGEISSYEQSQVAALQKLNTEWYQQLRSDPVVGGHAFEENARIAFETAEQWFGKQFIEQFQKLGLNNNPDLFKGLVKIGRAAKAPTFVSPGAPPPKRMTTEEVLFPSMFKDKKSA